MGVSRRLELFSIINKSNLLTKLVIEFFGKEEGKMHKKIVRLVILSVLAVSFLLPTVVPSLFNVAAATTIPSEVTVSGFTPYSEIPEILEELNASDRVLVQVIGQSAGGHDLYLATVADDTVLDNLDDYKEFAELTVEDPEGARDLVDNGFDYKATIFITGSIHGDEMMGTDACLDLIELLAYGDTEEVEAILDNTISLIYVCVNPDGRIADMRYNDNYFDMNRDWLTASQPEVRAGIEHVFKKWAPLVNIDLHGYMGEDWVLIEPCTPLHNPNAEEDLLLLNADAHLLPMAERMEARLTEIGIDTLIPYRDWAAEWDDYPPIFTPMYGFYQGCFGTTFESTDPYDKNGSPEISINAQYMGMLGAYEYIVENKDVMFEDQTEIFLRGINNEDHWLGGQPGSFPYAYILPMDPELQMDPIQTAKMVDFAIFHGVKVHRAQDSFEVNGFNYPAGTYVVLMNQSRAGLAMNMLWYGEDLSWDREHPPYDTYAWNFPELWGFTRIQASEPFDAELAEVEEASYPVGGVEGNVIYGYALKDDTNNAIIMINRLLKEEIEVYSATEPFEDAGKQFGVGTFIIPLQGQGGYIVETAEELHLTLYGLSDEPPANKTLLSLPRVAILFAKGVYTPAYGATQFILKNLEFDFDNLNYVDIRKGKLENYHIVVVTDGSAWTIWTKLANKGQRKLLQFIENGGTYFGFGEGGGYLVNYAKFLDAYAISTKWYGGYNNGIVRLYYDSTDPLAAYYPDESYAYAFFPVWFEDLGNDVKAVASYASEDMLVAGWWPFSEYAEGNAAVIRGAYGDGDVILSGVEPTFRAHTEFTFRLVANSIFFAASE